MHTSNQQQRRVRTLSNFAQEPTPHDLERDFAATVADLIAGDVVEEKAAPDVDTAEEAPAQETSTEPDVYTDDNGRLRDAKTHKFVEGTEEEEPETEEETPVEETDTDLPEEWELDLSDPRIAGYLAKYDGDLAKALNAAAEAQSMIGRQSSELGELRKLEQRLEKMQATLEEQATRPVHAPIDWGSAIERDPQQAAFEAARRRDVNALVEASEVWGEEEPFKASTFLANTLNEWRLETMAQEHAAARESAPAQATSDDVEIAKVLQKHPDLEDERILAQVGQVLQERPFLKRTVESGTPQEKAAALEDAYLIARSRHIDADTSEAIKKVQVRVSEESKKARADAAVVRASRSSAASASQPTRVDTFLDAFEARMQEKGLLAKDE